MCKEGRQCKKIYPSFRDACKSNAGDKTYLLRCLETKENLKHKGLSKHFSLEFWFWLSRKKIPEFILVLSFSYIFFNLPWFYPSNIFFSLNSIKASLVILFIPKVKNKVEKQIWAQCWKRATRGQMEFISLLLLQYVYWLYSNFSITIWMLWVQEKINHCLSSSEPGEAYCN